MAKSAVRFRDSVAQFERLSADIAARRFAPVYLLMGDESYFIDALCDRLASTILGEAERSFNQIVLYGRDTEPGQVINFCRQMPMMGSYEVVILKEAQQMRQIEKLSLYTQKPQASTILVVCHKEKSVDKRSAFYKQAAACGAVNTVCIKNGRAIGYNTDGRGFVDSLRARGLEPEGKTVLLLGTGGAGDAICDALVGAGVKKIFVTNRSVYPAQDLAARYPDKAQFIYFGIFPVRHAMAESDLFINATSLGMAGMKEFSDLGFLRDAPAGVTVYDLVYNPRQTMLLREAEKRGLPTVSGIDLLLYQAARAFKMFTGKDVDMPALFSALEGKLD